MREVFTFMGEELIILIAAKGPTFFSILHQVSIVLFFLLFAIRNVMAQASLQLASSNLFLRNADEDLARLHLLIILKLEPVGDVPRLLRVVKFQECSSDAVITHDKITAPDAYFEQEALDVGSRIKVVHLPKLEDK